MAQERDFTLSVVVKTYNAPDRLGKCLECLRLQSVQPDEILIADDGSGPETKAVIDAFAATMPIPVRHLWQEDDGFRCAIMLNRAYAAATGEFIITLDSDIITHRHFLKDYCYFVRPGYYLTGSVNWLTQRESAAVSVRRPDRLPLWVRLNHASSWRIPWLMRRVTPGYKRGEKYDLIHFRGGDNGMWREDVIRVNGNDEDFSGWGYEDLELGVRLYFAGVKRLYIKHGAIASHQWHPKSSRASAEGNKRRYEQAIAQRLTRCDNGMDKYL